MAKEAQPAPLDCPQEKLRPAQGYRFGPSSFSTAQLRNQVIFMYLCLLNN